VSDEDMAAFQAAWCEEPWGKRVCSSAGGRAADSVSRDVRSEARVAMRMTLAVVSVAVLVAQAEAQVAMGTAFAVSKDGDLVTNDHVISGCGSVEARLGSRMFSGTVKVGDRSADLAVIHIERAGPEAAVLRQSPALRVGEQSITYGFPLAGALARDGNLTIGYVSALRGLGDNPGYIQVTTPVQPGNSGGALIDASGNVIGVITAELNAMRVFRATGNVPQNVNFAIELEALKRFLRKNGIRTAEAPSAAELRPADIGDRARLFSYSIRCTRAASTVTTDAPTAPLDKTVPALGIMPAPGVRPTEAEHAVLYEESEGPGKSFAGTVIWHTLTVDTGPRRDQTIHASVQIPARLKMTLSIQPNRDEQGARFVNLTTSSDPPPGGVQSVAGILIKDGPDQRGIPLLGRPTKQAPGVFYFNMSAAESERDSDLLKHHAWVSIALLYNDGTRAVLVLNKGKSGERTFRDAFADWDKIDSMAPGPAMQSERAQQSCTSQIPDAPQHVTARVTGIVPSEEALAATRAVESQIGAKISPAYLTLPRVNAQLLTGQATLAAIPVSMTVKIGDLVELSTRYRDRSLPCHFIPWTINRVIDQKP
jgi:hypothetical protein